jgi:glutamine synthetase
MGLTRDEILSTLRSGTVEFVDLKLIDLPGTWHHITLPAEELTEEALIAGVPFDGSSLRGFREIEESDMIMLPDPETAFIDPFHEYPTLSIVCDVYDPAMQRFSRDPRRVAQAAEAHLKATGLGDAAYFGPELEFFVFDDVRYQVNPEESFFAIGSDESHWGSGDVGAPNLQHRIRPKSGYAPVAPTDQLSDLRGEMVRTMRACGMEVERHHHEVATAGQNEIGFRFGGLTTTADRVMLYKYIVKNVARRSGRIATFMPKPLFGDNGSGMHTHQSVFKDGKPLFYDKGGYGSLSQFALHYIAGILSHAPALVGLTNATTNSYRRLVPGFEAPVNLVFAKGNRSAAVRVPIGSQNPKAVRIEFRTPDATGNPYLSFAAMLMAGLDGVRRRLDPTTLGFGPLDKNIYHLPPEEAAKIQAVPGSLDEALRALEEDHAFLTEDGVFTEDLIQSWVDYKRREELHVVNLRPTPMEFHLYLDI